VGLLFGSVAQDLQKAERALKSSPQKAYEIYKSLYIKSLVDPQAAKEKQRILKGLIESARRSGHPAKGYEEELAALQKKDKKSPSAKDRLKRSVAKKGDPAKKSAKKGSLPRLRDVKLHKGYVELVFDRPLSKEAISFWRAKRSGRHKNIYDIRAVLAGGAKRYKLRSVDEMRIAQFDKNTVRVVFEDGARIYTKKELLGDRLLIHLSPKSRRGSVAKSAPAKTTYTPPPTPASRRVIVIDPGHGGKDSGAIGYKRKKEKDVVLAIARRLYDTLKRRGYKVYLTRRGDYFVPLRTRTSFANRVKADLFISVHANAAPNKRKYLSMKGLETFFLSPSRSERAKRVAAKENMVDMKSMSYFTKQVYLDFLNREKTILSNKLAIDIQRGVLASVRRRYSLVDGGVRPGPFWVLVGAQMPAVLVEVGYITNPTEAKRLSSPYYQKLIAAGIADGIESYFRNNAQ